MPMSVPGLVCLLPLLSFPSSCTLALPEGSYGEEFRSSLFCRSEGGAFCRMEGGIVGWGASICSKDRIRKQAGI